MKKDHPPSPAIRLYTDEGKANPSIDTSVLSKYIRALFVHWVQSGWHTRDFVEALDHTATGIYFDYLLEGSPGIALVALDIEAPLMAPPVQSAAAHSPGTVRRFYDDAGELNCGIDTSAYRRVLAPFFLRWVAAHYHARDFIQAVRDQAVSLVYDFSIACSMGGLGGCKTRQEFLAEPLQLEA